MIEVFAIKLIENKIFESHKKGLLSFLPKESQEAVLRHKTAKGAQRTCFGELISRKIIQEKTSIPTQEIHFEKTNKGKPFMKNSPIHFNISHSGDWVVLAVADIDVGIDVELLREINYRIATRFFSKYENALLEKLEGKNKSNLFFDFWTLKESYLKLLGTGLTKSLNSFTIVKNEDGFTLKENSNKNREPVYFRQYRLSEGYKLSACSYKNDFLNEPIIYTVEEILNDL